MILDDRFIKRDEILEHFWESYSLRINGSSRWGSLLKLVKHGRQPGKIIGKLQYSSH